MEGEYTQSAPKEQVVDRPPKRIRELHFGVLYACACLIKSYIAKPSRSYQANL